MVHLAQLLELNDLVNHFQEKDKTADDSTLVCHVNTQTHVPVLDDDIEENEVKDAVKKLKEDKSTGDGWVKPMISKFDGRFLSFITQLFMTIFSFHLYPTCWRTTLVNAIFKQNGNTQICY